jgi:hypothetical protein
VFRPAFLFVVCFLPALGAAQRAQPAVTGIRVTAEVASGLAAMPIGFFGGGLATRWVARRFGVTDDEEAGTIGTIGAYTFAAVATAVPPTLIGNAAPHTTGSYAAALGGAAIGGLGSWGLVRLNQPAGRRDAPCHFTCIASTVAIFLLPSAGATLGYNLSRRWAGPLPAH